MKESYNIFNIPETSKMVISSPLPEEVIKERDGGGNRKLSYISGATVTDLLNKAFGYNWNWEVKQFFVQESVPYINKWAKNDKDKGPQPQGPVAHVLGTLTIKFKDNENNIVTIKKDGFGSKSVLGKQNDQESIFKAADTDALKKAASRLGIGLELYRDEEEKSFFEIINEDNEDPWTEEALETHKESLDYILKLKEQTDEATFNETIISFSGGNLNSIEDITPDVIESFVEFLKELEKQANS